MNKILYSLFILLFVSRYAFAQDDLSDIVNKTTDQHEKEFVMATFKGLRIINAQSNETAKKHNLQFNIQHRFGDIAVKGSNHTFYGLDAATDIRFSFDYGITDNLQVGVGRSKGIQGEPYTELYDGNLKYKLLKQTTNNKMPLSVTLYGVAGITGRISSSDSTSDAYFEKTSHRLSYVTQAILARKFSSSFSFELLPTWVHRNFVQHDQPNDFFSLGIATRVKLSKRFALVADYYHNFNSYYTSTKDVNGNPIYYDPLSAGVEIETGGHVFQMMFTNAKGILENSYLPFTKSNWANGEFRWGFNITRNFVLGGKKW